MSYTTWLIRLVQHFFGPRFAQQRVRLMVTRGVLDAGFPELGGMNGFLEAVKEGPDWFEWAPETLRERGTRLDREWNHPEIRPWRYPSALVGLKDAPPFLPYLCLLCLAWTEAEDQVFADNAFYNRLSSLYPRHDLAAKLSEWDNLWDGLAKWTERLSNTWGQFVVERLGGMIHVGIPKSQVILTPGKIERLPDLFIACNLRPEIDITSKQLRDLLISNSPVCEQVLGANLLHQIQHETPLGTAALALISEYLDDWDGTAVEGTEDTGRGDHARTSSTDLLLVLQPKDDNTQWSASLGVEESDEFESIQFPDRHWGLVSVESTLALVSNASGKPIDAATCIVPWTNGLTVRGRCRDGSESTEDIIFRFPAKPLRFFNKWVGSRLVETQAMPTNGGFYVLIGPQVAAQWKEWLQKDGQNLLQQDFTWNGLPTGWRVVYLDKFGTLTDDERQRIPGSNGIVPTRLRVIRLVGGTQAHGTASRRVYAEYDPPLLVTHAGRDATIDVTGAVSKELMGTPTPAQFPGDVVRTFALEIEPSADVVIAKVAECNHQLRSVCFGIWREPGVFATNEVASTYYIDRFGEPTSIGTRGVLVPSDSEEWNFAEGNSQKSEACDDSVYQHKSIVFLESLHLHNYRLTFQEFRRRATEIAKVHSWRLYDETRWLAQLGFVEIQSDSRGRWSHVHANSLQLCTLPSKSGDRFQVVITGCGPVQTWKRIVARAGQLGCEVRVVDNCSRLIPPRLTLLHREAAAFVTLSGEFKLGWNSQPVAWRIANWSASLDDWLNKSSFNWFEGAGPRLVAEYIPSEFQIRADEQHHAPYRLCSMEDPYTRRHRWYMLVNNDAIYGSGLRHAFVRDSAWAMWKTQNAINDGDTKLAYDENTGVLVVPCQLAFPYLLGRALCVSSGLVPPRLRQCLAHSDRTAGILPEDSPPYLGPCYAYRLVPRLIAERVARKVCAQLCDVTLADSQSLP